MAITQRTRKLLWTRAANRCAICRRRLTKDPAHVHDREAILGSECHIVARKPDGPRGGEIDPALVDDYANLILLCANDHKEVDDQPGEYTVERLREIKRDHERWVDETLDWRASMPESAWIRLKEEVREFVVEGPPDEGVADLLEWYAAFTSVTAEFLAAEELVLFTRRGEVALAYKYERGKVLIANADGDGFHTGFAAFNEADGSEDRTAAVRAHSEAEDREEDTPGDEAVFESAVSTLLAMVERIGIPEAVFYVRGFATEAPERAFRVLGGTIEFSSGPAGVFAQAYESFARQPGADISHRVESYLAKGKGASARGDGAGRR